MRISRALAGYICLVVLCSCATERSTTFPLPASVSMNQGAGRGDELLLKLHLEDGQNLWFIFDTGSSGILLDKSLEPKLGSCLWTHKINPWYGMRTLKLFRAPKLFLGDTRLQTSGWIWTGDLRLLSKELDRTTHTNRPIMGVLGMSCLKHYCIQLDFAANRVRFLDEEYSNKQDWGEAFPLKRYDGDFAIHENLVGIKGPASVIDSGCNFDGFLTPQLFREWTNQATPSAYGEARCPKGVLGRNIYTNVYLHGDGTFNAIGLSFLARHLVTFDFPNRTVYLKQRSVGPLVDKESEAALEFLKRLKEKGQLPGWAKDDKGRISTFAYPSSGILDAWRKGNTNAYHYLVVHDSKDGVWKLQKAWQSDANDNLIKLYSLP